MAVLETVVMKQGERFTRTITLPANSVVSDLTGWTPSAQMREKRSSSSPLVLSFSASISDGPNRIILIEALPAVTAAVTKSGFADVFIEDDGDATKRYRVKQFRVLLDPSVTE